MQSYLATQSALLREMNESPQSYPSLPMSTLGSNEIQKILGLRLMIGNSDTELKDIQPISLPPKLREYTQEPE